MVDLPEALLAGRLRSFIDKAPASLQRRFGRESHVNAIGAIN
jgi:hypothetical protein